MTGEARSVRVVVLGARSLVGPYLCARLAALGYGGECLSRRAAERCPVLPAGFTWRQPGTKDDWTAPAGVVVLSLVPLWAVPAFLPRLEGARQIVALGSTSVLTKADSADAAERELAGRLAAAERDIAEGCGRGGLGWTILRPTLIYDGRTDHTVCAIAGFIRRFGFFPLARPGRGLRQPVHADDVAAAMIGAIGNDRALGSEFDLPGGETLAYRDMVRRIFRAMGQRPLIVALPATLLRLGWRVAGGRLPADYSPALIERMNRDLAFDGSPAAAVLGHRPRRFAPELTPPPAVGEAR